MSEMQSQGVCRRALLADGRRQHAAAQRRGARPQHRRLRRAAARANDTSAANEGNTWDSYLP